MDFRNGKCVGTLHCEVLYLVTLNIQQICKGDVVTEGVAAAFSHFFLDYPARLCRSYHRVIIVCIGYASHTYFRWGFGLMFLVWSVQKLYIS